MQNIPEFLNELLLNEYGQEITNQIITGYSANRPTTFRVNTSKVSVEYIKNKLNELEINFKEVPWNETAFIIENIREKEIKELDIYKKRRNLSSKFIFYDTTNSSKSKRRRKHIRYGSSSWWENNSDG